MIYCVYTFLVVLFSKREWVQKLKTVFLQQTMTACFKTNVLCSRRLVQKSISFYHNSFRIFSVSESDKICIQKPECASNDGYIPEISTLDNGYIYYFMNTVFRNKLIKNGLWNCCWIIEPKIFEVNIDEHYKLLISLKDDYSENDLNYLNQQQLKYGKDKLWNLSKFNIYPNPVEIRDKWLQLDDNHKYDYNYLYKYSYHGFCSIGLPLFDTTHKFCSLQYQTKTMNIVHEKFIFSFQQINHNWRLIKTFHQQIE